MEIRFAPVPRRVEPYGHPEVASSAQHQAEKQVRGARLDSAHPTLIGIAVMKPAEEAGKENG